MKYKIIIPGIILSAITMINSSLFASQEIKNADEIVPIQINDTKITLQEYQSVLLSEMRKRFYHLKVPAEDKNSFPLEIADKLINQYLMLEELKKQDIKVDMTMVKKHHKKEMNKINMLYKEDENWKKAKAQYSKELMNKLKLRNQLDMLTQKIKTVPQASQKDVRAYYKAHPGKFMAPVQQRVAVIILSVPPSSNNETWDNARAQAKMIRQQLKQGKTFAEMAELFSSDISAEMGGDMGFIHHGMLGDAAQKVIDQLKVSEVSESVTLLEGIALLKLTDRVPEKLNTFERVKSQANKMLQEERSEQAWKTYITSLRQNAKIILHKDMIKTSL